MKMKIGKMVHVFLIASAITTISCEKDDTADKADKELYDMAIETVGFTWYKNNEVAAASLDENGKIMGNAMFAEGSLIVKELYADESTLSQYAILYKRNNSEFSDKDGWEWGYMNAKGDVIESVSKKGNSCISCHTQEGSIDHMLMNKYFP